MNSKEKAIELEWIDHYQKNGINVRDAKDEVESLINNGLIDENGFADYGVDDLSEFGIEPFGEVERTEVKNRVYKWRPISLQGIETNNGWTAILSEKDLPSEDCACEIRFKDGLQWFDRFYISTNNFSSTHYHYITHYKIIKKSNPPIH